MHLKYEKAFRALCFNDPSSTSNMKLTQPECIINTLHNVAQLKHVTKFLVYRKIYAWNLNKQTYHENISTSKDHGNTFSLNICWQAEYESQHNIVNHNITWLQDIATTANVKTLWYLSVFAVLCYILGHNERNSYCNGIKSLGLNN